MPDFPDLNDLMKALMALREGQSEARGPAPVDLWNPPECGDIGMEIRQDGSWWHQGTRITRQPLVELFASVLRKDEDGRSWLVTPAEKVIVHVQDAHFLGTRVDHIQTSLGPSVAVTTNVGDLVVIGPQNPLRVAIDKETRAPRPYVRVRGRLEARLVRAAFYELVEMGQENNGRLTLMSQGMVFDLGSLEGQSV
jgi:uncharacterized protein